MMLMVDGVRGVSDALICFSDTSFNIRTRSHRHVSRTLWHLHCRLCSELLHHSLRNSGPTSL